MKKKLGAFVTGSWVVAFEGLAVLAGLAILAAGGLFWRLSAGPIDIGLLRPYIEEALSDPARGLSVGIGQAVLEWEGAGAPLLIGLEDFRLIQNGTRVLFSVDRAAASLSLPMLALGRIEPRTVALEGPAIRLVRRKDDVIEFGTGTWVFSIPATFAPVPSSGGTPGKNLEQAGAWLWALTASSGPDRAVLPSFLQKLRTIEIRTIKLMVEDHVNGVSWFLPRSDFLYTNRNGSVSVDIGLGPPGKDPRGALRLEVQRGADPALVDVKLSARQVDPRLFADRFGALAVLKGQNIRVDLEGSARLSRELAARDARLTVSAGAATLEFPDFYTHPLSIESLRVEALYDPARDVIEIPAAVLRTGGVDLVAKARAVRTGSSVALSASLNVSDISTATLQGIYPDNIPEDNSREWVIRRISGGRFHGMSADAGLILDTETDGAVLERLETSFSFDGVDVNYRPPLMPVEKAKGSGKLDIVKNVLTFKGESATIRDMKARNILLTFDEVMTAGKGTADIAFDLSGPLATGLRYVASEPIKLGDDLGLDPDAVRGTVDFHVNIAFPTVRNLLAEQVKVRVGGEMSDLFLPAVVKELALTGGPLTLETTDGSFRVKGKASLADRPVTLDWRQHLKKAGAPFSSQVTASLGVDKGLRDHFGIDIDDFLSGTVPVTLTYTEYAGGKSEADVKADLGPVRAMIRPFAYDKPPGGTGSVTLKARLLNGDLKTLSGFTAQGPDLNLSGGALSFEGGHLRRADFKSFRVGETDVALDLESSGPDSALKVSMTGPFLDARPFLNPEGAGSGEGEGAAYDGPAISASVNVTRLRTKDARVIESARVALDMSRGGDLTRIDARARIGAGDFFMRLAPDAGGVPALRIEAQDAGSTLRAFNIYENVLGGRLTATGKPSGKGRRQDITGIVTIENFKVVNAPVLAQLVSAMSLPGLLQLLGNEGLGFSRAQAAFEWKIRDSGTSYVFREGRTSGNSLGLTFDGVVDKTRNELDISGTIVPVSEVNSLLSNIPLVGDILTGGSDGGILAATYSVKGNADRPRVMVNPLAALAPGIFRRIFFEGEKPSAKQDRKDRAPSPGPGANR